MGLVVVAPDIEPVRNVSVGAELDLVPFDHGKGVVKSMALAIDRALEISSKTGRSQRNRSHVVSRYTWHAQCGLISEYIKGVTKSS